MKHSRQIRVIGIGSPHGDDQAGWRVIDYLATDPRCRCLLNKLAAPHQLLDGSNPCDALHLIDACESGTGVLRIDLSDHESMSTIRGLKHRSSSHQIGIHDVIELGRLLGQLPQRIVVWAVPGSVFGPQQGLSDSCHHHVAQCARQLVQELVDA
jgi:hydrogenase maturation protease